MQRFSFALLGAAVSGAFVFACGGLDPNDYGAQPAPAAHGGQAGYSYDAGVTAAGSGGKSASGPPTTKGPSSGGRAQQGEAGAEGNGEAGEGAIDAAGGASDGGTGGSESNAGRAGSEAGSGRGGAAGQAGSWSWGGRGGTQAGGRSGSAGQAGSANGGRAGAGGAAGRGGYAGVAGTNEPVPTPVHDLVFSEYVEGSSALKALEIRAARASTLSGCEIVTYFNGGEDGRRVALEGEVASGDVYVLCSSKLELELGAAVCDRGTNLTFNGNDAIALECDGVVLDVIGRVGEDPGTAWEASGTLTADQTLRRRCSTPTGDTDGTDAFDPSAAWLALPTDSFDGLGDAACAEAVSN